MTSPAIIGFEDLNAVPFHLWGIFLYACHLRRGEPISARETALRFGMDWRTASNMLDELVRLGHAQRVAERNRRYSYYPSDKWEELRQSAKEEQLITRHRLSYGNYVG